MRLPRKKKPGDPVLAADWNLLLDAIDARTPRPGSGLELIASSGGFAYSLPPPKAEIWRGLPPFSVIAIAREDDAYKVTLKEGWVIERQPKTDDPPAVKFHMPATDGTALDTIPRPEIAMAIGDTLYCRIKTDTMGLVTGTPELVVSSETKDGIHYQPDDDEASGEDGDYHVKLIKLEDDEGTPKVKIYQQSDIEHWAQIWSGENKGNGAKVYKEHDAAANVHVFRSLRGDYGVRETGTADEVELDLWAENTGNGSEVYVVPKDADGLPLPDPPDGPARFRTIGPRESLAQIQVVCPDDSDVIRVQGNDASGSLLDGSGNTIIAWADGLITTTGQQTISTNGAAVNGNYGITSTVAGNQVNLDFRGENKGGGSELFISPGANPAAGPAQFRTIVARSSEPQVTVTQDSESIRVEGNGADGSLKTDQNVELLAWKDGLLATSGPVTLTTREITICDNGTPVAVRFVVIQ